MTVTAQPVECAPEVSVHERVEILGCLLTGLSVEDIAQRRSFARATVADVAATAGHPDRGAVRAVFDALKRAPKMPFGPPLEPDFPAVHVALAISAALRDRDKKTLAQLVGGFDRHACLEVALAALAMLAPDTDPGRALEWLDLPPGEWSGETLRAESARWVAGARDKTAVAAHRRTRQ